MWIWVKKMFGESKEDRLNKIHRNLVSHKSSNAKTVAKATSYRKAHPRKAARLINSYRSDFPGYYDDDDLLFMIMMYMFIYEDFGDYGDMYTEIDMLPEESYSEFMPDEMETMTVTSGEILEEGGTHGLDGSADSLVDDDITVAETPAYEPPPEPRYEPPAPSYDPPSYDSGSSYDSGGSDSGGGDD